MTGQQTMTADMQSFQSLEDRVDVTNEVPKLKQGGGLSVASGSTKADADMHGPAWKPRYVEFKGWVSREGWKDSEIRQREALSQDALTTAMNGLIGSIQIDATQRVALDLDRTVQENTGRYWPYTRGRIYFKPGTSSDILWKRNVCGKMTTGED
eukprot:1093583-Pyramimonas_sp.AAC.1